MPRNMTSYREAQKRNKTNRMLRHENNRWDTMSIDAMKMRIRKMTRLPKLDILIQVARERGAAKIAQLAGKQKAWLVNNELASVR